MTFALLIICGLSGAPCEAFTYDEAPYASRAECQHAHAVRRPIVRANAFALIGQPARVREVCSDLKSIRGLSPDAYPEHAIEEAV